MTISNSYKAEWLNYWANSYNFTGRLAKLNKYPLYTTNIQGLDMTFYRITPKNPDQKTKVSLLMRHGFPSSPVACLEAIGHLINPETINSRDFVVKVILPCLPGFGYFSITIMSPEMLALAATLAVFQGTSDYTYTGTPKLNTVELAEDRWWGEDGQQGKQDTGIYSYTVKYDDAMIADLKARLNSTRTKNTLLEGVAPFAYGFNQLTLNNWTDYWMNKYDFKKQEALWNKYPAYKTNIQGLDIVFFRVTPKVDNNTELLPMLIQHGWPGSPHEFWKTAEFLTAVSPDRNFAIDLIMPCLAGFGFSQATKKPGLGSAQMAVIMRNLMHRLGFKKYYLQGGDLGALTLNNLVTQYPDEVLGYHTNLAFLPSPTALLFHMLGSLYPPLVTTNSTYSRMYPIESKFFGQTAGSGYLHLQATRPDTLGVALSDSPIGMLAYCMQTAYITSATDPNGGLLKTYTQDFLIDMMMFYWSTRSMPTAMRFYAEHFNKNQVALGMELIPTNVKMAIMQDTGSFTYQSPTILGLKFRNIIQVNDQIPGFHFIAYEQPELFAKDVLQAVVKFRALDANSQSKSG